MGTGGGANPFDACHKNCPRPARGEVYSRAVFSENSTLILVKGAGFDSQTCHNLMRPYVNGAMNISQIATCQMMTCWNVPSGCMLNPRASTAGLPLTLHANLYPYPYWQRSSLSHERSGRAWCMLLDGAHTIQVYT